MGILNQHGPKASRPKWGRVEIFCLIAAAIVSCLSLWGGLRFDSFTLFCIGFPGDILLILLTGVHGGGTRNEMIIAGTLCIAVNAFLYYLLFCFAARKMLKPRKLEW